MKHTLLQKDGVSDRYVEGVWPYAQQSATRIGRDVKGLPFSIKGI